MYLYHGKPVQLQYREYQYTPEFPGTAFLHGEYSFPPVPDSLKIMHFHNLCEIGICFSGDNHLYLEDQVFHFSGGSIYIIPPYAMHMALPDQQAMPSHCEYFCFSLPDMLKDVLTASSPSIEKLCFFNHASFNPILTCEEQPLLFKNIEAIFCELHEKKPFYKSAVKALLLSFFCEAAQAFHTMQPDTLPALQLRSLIDPALKYIENHYMEKINVKMLADICHMSPNRFHQVFTECLTHPPVSYINQIRLGKASSMLIRTELSIITIAIECGYGSAAHFNRRFQEYFHISPSEFRHQHRRIPRKNLSHSLFTAEE